MRDKLAIKNGVVTLICQIFDLVLGFVSRRIFIECLGVAMLGISGTFTSLLHTLSLAELGFESAVIFSLYKPMKDNNKTQIEEIVVILKRVYEIVGVFVMGAGIVMSFFLPAFLKGVKVNDTIYLAFYIQLAGTAATYFLAYKRTFLLALQKDYIRNIIISVLKIITVIIQIILMVLFKSFVIYVAVSVAQNLAINIIIKIYVDKMCDYNFKTKGINKFIFRGLIRNVKDIFFSKLAGYVYSSTDNIIISACIGTVSVGMLGNYTQILYQMKSVITNMFTSTKPIVGHYLTAETDKEHSFQILNNYTFVRYIVTLGLFVPGFVLCDCFIESWLGVDYVMSKVISLLLVSDIFIHFVHGALVDYIAGLGFFRQDRNISIIGAVVNLVCSFLLVKWIGLPGVLAGTVIAQIYFWASRSVVIFKDYFHNMSGMFRQYWLKCVGYVLLFLSLCFGCSYIFEILPFANSYSKFIIGGGVCLFIIIPVVLLLYSRTDEFGYLLQLGRKILSKRKKERKN